MRLFFLAFLLVALFAFSSVPALAQGCGLPTSGTVTVTTTYTLTADCTMTDTLAFGTTTANADKITITINGGGHTITGTSNACGANPAGKVTIRIHPNVEFNLNNVTIKGGGVSGGGAVSLENSAHSATFSNVTFDQTNCAALRLGNDHPTTPTAVTHSLSNVLFVGVRGQYYTPAHGNPSGIHTVGPVSLNINNIALRGITSGNAAIGANDTYIGGGTATKGRITFSGCLTVDGVFPRVWYGDIVDNSTGPCSDTISTIGNGGSVAMANPQAPVSPCGLPLGGFIYGKHTFSLRGDCVMRNVLFIPYESDVVVKGNGYTIDGAATGNDIFWVAGEFSLNNAVVTGANRITILTYMDKEMRISNSIFRDNAGPLYLLDSIVTLDKVLIENHSQTRENWPSAVALATAAQLTIRDSVIRGNTGGLGALYTGAPYQHSATNPGTTLEGCITFEDNSPRDILDSHSLLTDSRTEPCPPDMTFLVPIQTDREPSAPSKDRPPAQPAPRPLTEVCAGKPGAVPVGAVACIFRHEGLLSVWGIDAQSQGFFMVAATQAQIDAVCAGLVAASSDGRAAIFVLENRDVIVSVGPDYEGKVLHVRLDGGMYGRALAIATTYGPPPGLGIPASQPEACARALHGCMVRTNNIVNFRDAPNGSLLRFVDIWGIYNDGMLPYDVTLTALERTQDWFKVDYHGTQGWISAHYVEAIGACG